MEKEECPNVAEYTSISLNIPKDPLKCLNKLFWWCQDSEHVWSSYIFDRFLKMPTDLNARVPNMGRLYMQRQTWQWMMCERTRTLPHTPVFIFACYRRTCKTLCDKLITCQHFSKCAQLFFCKQFVCSFNVNCHSYCSFLFLSNIKKFVLQFPFFIDHQ